MKFKILGIITAFTVSLFLLFFSLARVNIKPSNPSSISIPSPNYTSTPSPKVSLIAVGDISFSRSVEKEVKKKNDYNYPFLKVKDFLKTGDIVFGNLETPITPGREIQSGEMIFRSNPQTAQALKEAGFTLVSLANNHTPNFGEKGLLDTFEYLSSQGIKYVGAGKNSQEAYSPVILEIRGIKFAFFAYTDQNLVPSFYEAAENQAGTAFLKEERLRQEIDKIRSKVNFIIISLHSGEEYTPQPNNRQTNFAHRAVDFGADLVIGHHPHVVQTAEKYKDKYIFYSLGNFVFDQMWSQQTKQGLAIKVDFSKEKVERISLFPVIIENFCQPRFAEEKEKKQIIKRLMLYNLNYENGIYYISN